MNSRAIISLIVAFAGLITGCKPNLLSPVDYKEWVENCDNGLNIQREIGDIKYELQYKPIPYIILLENQGKMPEVWRYSERVKELRGMEYYTLKISTKTNEDILRFKSHNESEYYSRLEYYADAAQNDISLIRGNDTTECALYHFERNYGLSPWSTIVLGFETKEEKTGERTIFFHNQVQGTGTVKFALSQEDISELPALME